MSTLLIAPGAGLSPYYEEIVANLHSSAIIVGVPLCAPYGAVAGRGFGALSARVFNAQQCQLFIKVRSPLRLLAAHDLETNASINIYFGAGIVSMTNDIVHYGSHSWSISKQ